MRTTLPILIAAAGLAVAPISTAQDTTAQNAATAQAETQTATKDMTPEQRVKAFENWAQTANPATAQQQLPMKATEFLAGIDYASLTAEQLATLMPLVINAPQESAKAIARLGELRTQESVDGALAASTHAVLSAFTSQQRVDGATLDGLLNHEHFYEAIESGHLLTPLLAVSFTDPTALQERSDKIAGIADHFPEGSIEAEESSALSRYWQVASSFIPASEAETLESVRSKTAAALRRVELEGEPADTVSAVKQQIAAVDGAFARGELLDHQAPEVEFLWSSDTDGAQNLDDLKGKVVVIDFWATWCGPCIRSFPNVAELVDHYEGYEVAVVGLTAPQGRHHGADGSVTPTTGDRDKEFSLMEGFIEAKDITWPIAFSEPSVWTEFGIQGIPHIAIIDPEGVVRYRGLHPAGPMQEKVAKINELLTEAGLESPES